MAQLLPLTCFLATSSGTVLRPDRASTITIPGTSCSILVPASITAQALCCESLSTKCWQA